MVLAIGMSKPIKIVGLAKRWLAVNPALACQVFEIAPTRITQRPINQLALAHGKTGVLSTNPAGQCANHFVVVTATFGWLDNLRA